MTCYDCFVTGCFVALCFTVPLAFLLHFVWRVLSESERESEI